MNGERTRYESYDDWATSAQAEIDRLRTELDEAKEHLTTMLYYCPGSFPKAQNFLAKTAKEEK